MLRSSRVYCALTLEQVLARSLKTPRRRKTAAKEEDDLPRTVSAVPEQQLMKKKEDRQTIFERLDVEEQKRMDGRLSIKPVDRLSDFGRNSDDVVSNLRTAARMGDWVEALEIFERGTNANSVHGKYVKLLVEACCVGGRLDAILENGRMDKVCRQNPQLIRTGVAAVCSCLADSGEWEAAFDFFQTNKDYHSKDAMNSCVSACDSANSWEGALRLIETAPAPPDAIAYASVISLLERCQRKDEAAVLLETVPPSEREAIIASYAALIHVWSENQSKKKRF